MQSTSHRTASKFHAVGRHAAARLAGSIGASKRYPRFRRERFSACRFGSLEAVPPALEAHDFLVILDGAGQTQQAQFMTTLLQRHELLPSLGVKMGRASFPGSDHVVERLKGCIDFGNGPLHACALSEVQRPSDTAFR